MLDRTSHTLTPQRLRRTKQLRPHVFPKLFALSSRLDIADAQPQQVLLKASLRGFLALKERLRLFVLLHPLGRHEGGKVAQREALHYRRAAVVEAAGQREEAAAGERQEVPGVTSKRKLKRLQVANRAARNGCRSQGNSGLKRRFKVLKKSIHIDW